MTDHFIGRELGPKSYNCEGVFTNSFGGNDRSRYSSTRTGVIKTALLVVKKKEKRKKNTAINQRKQVVVFLFAKGATALSSEHRS